MKRQGFLGLLRITWQGWMATRSFFFLLAFGWLMGPLVFLFVWRAAGGGGGYDSDAITFYYLVLMIVNQFTMTQANWVLGDNIRYGGLSAQLLRPQSPLVETLAAEIAGKGVFLAFTAPVVLVLLVLLRPEVAIPGASILRFVPALAIAWLLRFSWGVWLALLAFWAARSDALLGLQEALLFLFAGIVAPVSLLPSWLGAAARFLPFRYMIGFPVEVLSGEIGRAHV